MVLSTDKKCIGIKKQNNNYVLEKNIYGFRNWKLSNSHKQLKELYRAILNVKEFHTQSLINNQSNKEYVKEYLLNVIKSNPQIDFYLIIPTYSRLAYRINISNEYPNQNNILFYNFQYSIKWLIEETDKFTNVKIYGFDNYDYADDLNNYKDPFHYNTDMNSMQLDAIKNQTNILTPENMDEYFKIMEEKIKNYDLNPLIEQIKASGILDK